MNNNIEEFNLLYKQIYNENLKEKLDKIKKRKNIEGYINVLILFILPVLYMVLGPYILRYYNIQNYSATYVIIGVVVWIVLMKLRSKPINRITEEEDLFNKEVIYPLIQNILPESNYEPYIGMNEEEYFNCVWEKFDTFHSGGKIVAPLKLDVINKNMLELYEVITEETVRYGNESRIKTCFEGVCCYVKLPKNIQMYTKITNKENKIKVKENNLIMDMPEFENKFFVETNNDIKTMQILTSDVMMYLIEFVNTSEMNIDIYINNDNMYIRFHTSELLFERKFNKKRLKEGYDKLKSIKNIVEYISNIIINVQE